MKLGFLEGLGKPLAALDICRSISSDEYFVPSYSCSELKTQKDGHVNARLKSYFVAFMFRKMMGVFATNSVIDSHYTIKSIVKGILAESLSFVNSTLC